MYTKISGCGIIGDIHSIALICNVCTIDWMRIPHIDSPGTFGVLLDHKGGALSAYPPLMTGSYLIGV